jgi:hypothetical protein
MIAALTSFSPEPAAASPAPDIYDTVDAFELNNGNFFVTGIIHGQSVPSTTNYRFFGQQDSISQCQRFVLLAMSKPGKFQLVLLPSGVSSPDGCKLVLRSP